MSLSKDAGQFRNGDIRQLAAVLQRLSYAFQAPVELVAIQQALLSLATKTASSELPAANKIGGDEFRLMQAAQQVGIRLAPARLSLTDAMHLVKEGFPVVIEESAAAGSAWWVVEQKGRRAEAYKVDADVELLSGTSADIAAFWSRTSLRRCYVAQPALNCQTLTAVSNSEGDGVGPHHSHFSTAHRSPFSRFRSLLKLELRDITTLVLFGVVSGFMGLATPLAVESLVNTVAWGTYLQPLLVLSLMLLCFLGFAGFLRALQAVIAEILQQRIFVRIVGDLGYRFARAKRVTLDGEDAREFSNRFFDIMTIQKATASLLLDGMTIVLQTVIGLILLAFYHPYLLGFDVVLVFSMTVITWLLGKGAVKSAISESIVKYRIGHWLQDVLANPTAFHIHGGSDYAADRANRLTVEYLLARRTHFRVLIRQFAFAIFLQAIASTALLGVGGWLVINGELTLGQLVASELVVTAIVSAFAKIGKSLESFYDLMAAVDKVGHLLDLPTDAAPQYSQVGQGPAKVRWQNLSLASDVPQNSVSSVTIEPGSRVAITGCSASGKSWLFEVLAGLRQPLQGFAEVAGLDVREADLISNGSLVSLARGPEIFHGSLLENVRLGRGWISEADVRAAMDWVGLWGESLMFSDGIDTVLQSGGYPLSDAQRARLMLARAIVAKPSVLLIDATLELFSPSERLTLWNRLKGTANPWTLLISTYDERILADCTQVIQLGRRKNEK